MEKERIRVIIMGAAGRDFHNFNIFFKDNPKYEVIAFTATQIPDIAGRVYPGDLSGSLYPEGVPIYPEDDLSKLIDELKIDQVIFAYSDVSHEYVMHKASQVLAKGADFRLMGINNTSIKAKVPLISVCAVRTGSGKSQTTRRVVKILREMGKKVVSIRHPMPYGNLKEQEVQRYASYEDLDRFKCTIEEREEYEPHVDLGAVIYSGVDYKKILEQAEKEAEVIVWDGGNNDFPFYQSDLKIVVADPLRPGHEIKYHPGETNLRMADVIVINKINSAIPENVTLLRESIFKYNPEATVIEAASPIFVDGYEGIKGKKVLVIEDGPTLTHGEMSYGAGVVAAMKFGAKEIIEPMPYAVGSILDTFNKYHQVRLVLPAMGYGEKQIKELEDTINKVPADLVLIGTPIDLRRVIKINKPALRVRYELQEIGTPDLQSIIKEKIK